MKPRRCRQCHAPATYAEIEKRPASIIHTDGTIERFFETVVVYYCDHHTGMELP